MIHIRPPGCPAAHVLALLGLTLCLSIPFPTAPPEARAQSASPQNLQVVVVLSRNLEPYNTARTGFRDALTEAGFQLTGTTYNLEGAAQKIPDIVKSIRENPPDLILTLGTLATQEIAAAIQDIPVVFSMVLDPESSGLVSHDRAIQQNVTGVTMDIAPAQQLDALLTVLPETHRIGLLFNPAESGATVAGLEAAASARGLTIVAEPIGASKDVSRAFRTVAENCDTLLAIPDATVYTESTTRYILLNTLRQAQPFVGLLESFVEAGALMGVGLDYQDLGHQTGALAIRLIHGRVPQDIAIESPRKTTLLLNLRTARRIGVPIPDAVRDSATVVVP